MDLKTTKFILSSTFMIIIAVVLMITFIESQLLTYIMMGFLFVFVTVYALFLRCPKCKKHIGKMTARKCKHCGQDLT